MSGHWMEPKEKSKIASASLPRPTRPGAAESAGARLEMAYCEYIEKEYETCND